MRFKEWIRLTEAGHMIFQEPMDLTILLHGKPVTLRGVDMVDPRFEFLNVPNPQGSASKTPKFLGAEDFSLPLYGQMGNITQWLASQRSSMMSGNGFKSMKPVGYAIQNYDWSKAQVIGTDGSDLISKLSGGDQAAVAAG